MSTPGTPRVMPSDIPGLLVIDLHLVADARGWFKEGWQREKMVAAGLPDFGPVQNNLSFNTTAGVTRGFHAEPWDKLVSVATGRVFGAWVDLREGSSFGRVVTVEIDAGRAVFVPRGVGNAYQALEDGTCYTYLVNEHWSAEAKSRYVFTNLSHQGVDWPIPLSEAVLSEADQNHPSLSEVVPFRPPTPLVVGASGQLGRALRHVMPNATFTDRGELDITDAEALETYDFNQVSAIVNAAAWTDVDAAEGDSRAEAWRVNVTGPANLVAAARRHRLPVVNISSDYVFDGVREIHHEDEPVSPLSVYGATKAAADSVVATWSQHYILRTSWVIGEGPNFVLTMARLADAGSSPSVVSDQHGRLTFADDLARAVAHVLTGSVPYGTYNITSDGETVTWYDIARAVFEARGAAGIVRPITSAEYAEGRRSAQRPRHSALSLDKIKGVGFDPRDGWESLLLYIKRLA